MVAQGRHAGLPLHPKNRIHIKSAIILLRYIPNKLKAIRHSSTASFLRRTVRKTENHAGHTTSLAYCLSLSYNLGAILCKSEYYVKFLKKNINKKFRLSVKISKAPSNAPHNWGKCFRQDKTAADAGLSPPLKLPNPGKWEQIVKEINRNFAKFILTLPGTGPEWRICWLKSVT